MCRPCKTKCGSKRHRSNGAGTTQHGRIRSHSYLQEVKVATWARCRAALERRKHNSPPMKFRAHFEYVSMTVSHSLFAISYSILRIAQKKVITRKILNAEFHDTHRAPTCPQPPRELQLLPGSSSTSAADFKHPTHRLASFGGQGATPCPHPSDPGPRPRSPIAGRWRACRRWRRRPEPR